MSAAAAAAQAAVKNGSSSSSSIMTRAMYLARLRRAFLLRVHPDRFRNYESNIVQGQAVLVKALSERMSQADFTAWQAQAASHSQSQQFSSLFSKRSEERPRGDFLYTMERRDGTLLKAKLRLDQPVDAILASMAETLRKSGAPASSLPKAPPPPVAAEQQASNPYTTNNSNQHHQSSWPFEKSSSTATSTSSFSSRVDHRYDVVSNQGRNLLDFLERLDRNDIQKRKASRMDAQAAALQVRRVYQFQAVDATSLGWSSASVAVLLHRLLALHTEHSEKFHVQSFYPIRLVFWPESDDILQHHALDVHGGGVLILSPAATPLQWLEKIQLVTPQAIERVRFHREQVQEMTTHVQGLLGVKLRKGYSCSNREYYDFLCRLCEEENGAIDDDPTARGNEEDHDDHHNNALIPEPQLAIIESHQACRRPIVTKDGAIRLGAGMDNAAGALQKKIHKLSDKARERRAQQAHDKQASKEWSQRVAWELGLQRVYRTTNRVSHQDFSHSLGRLLSHHTSTNNNTQDEEQEIRQRLKAGLTGNGLGIAGTGQFCHLADDGSIVIPHDWR